MTPWNCYHGISLRGPNPPECLECEILWCTETAKWMTKAADRNTRKLEELLARRAALHPAAPSADGPMEEGDGSSSLNRKADEIAPRGGGQ